MKRKKSILKKKMSRRQFVKNSVYTGLALGMFPAILTHSSDALAASFGANINWLGDNLGNRRNYKRNSSFLRVYRTHVIWPNSLYYLLVFQLASGSDLSLPHVSYQ